MSTLQDRVVLSVHKHYDALPAKSKPGVDGEGRKLWVPLSGIVLFDEDTAKMHCVALATGMKCLPVTKVQSGNGCVIHDWHAEILAIRLFNSFLLQECLKLLQVGSLASEYVRQRSEHEMSISKTLQPFTIKESIQIHMYCSEAPCGDASMELTMDAQEDATPWETPETELQPDVNRAEEQLRGRGYFSELGIVRRKPGRADSPPTLSKSCSDKIALKQCTSLLSSPASLLVSPENAYITSLILPEPQYVPSACERAFSADGRMKDLSGRSWPGGYSFRPFEVLPTSVHFENSKSNSGSRSTNVSGAWTPHMRETLINGVLQGRKQSDPRGASIVSRQKMWATIAQIIKKLAYPPLTGLLKKGSYARLKQCKQLDDHRRVKEDAKALGLPGWVSNKVDDFELVHDTDQP